MSVIDFDAMWACLDEAGVGHWRSALETTVRERLSDDGHGDFSKWREVLSKLATEPGQEFSTEPGNDGVRRDLLLRLSPWRKGPFRIGSIEIDAEWRSDMKWDRVKDAVEPLDGRTILDVGCGNGYYGLCMRDAGARVVIGIDPTILYVVQFIAISRLLDVEHMCVLPLRLDELPAAPQAFDSTFSMGVLYHQRSPLEHLRQLRDSLRPGGQLVLETIYVPGEESYACTPPDRYARMRNVWLLPTIAELTTWLKRSGFRDIAVVDKSRTTPEEQRTTPWMTFESLAEALKPDDPDWTVEGWPAPRRVVLIAKSP